MSTSNEQPLSQGGFSDRHLMHDYQIGKRVCTTAGAHLHYAQRADGSFFILKQPHTDTLTPAQLSRFRREYELLQSLTIDSIVKPLALVEEQTRPVMVLDDLDGEPFELFLDRQRLDVFACLRLGSQLARLLADLHAAGLTHRDVRPANLWLAPQQQKLLLLDVSQAINPQSASSGDSARGDWAYLAPELTGRMNRPVDFRADMYSFGITLYRMLTGRLPFAANDPLEWVHCHVARLPSSPRDIHPDIPRVVSDIVMKLMAKLPEDRYQSMYGVRADLDRCMAQWQADGEVLPFVLGTEDFSGQFYIPRKLYGREPEVASLRAAFTSVVATGQPTLVTVCGYSGIGKSALVHELQAPIVRERGYFISGKFDQYLHDTPYATFTQALRELIRQLLAENEARIAGWRKDIQSALGVHGQLIVDILPQIELLIGKQPPVPSLPPVEAQNRFRRVFRQFLSVFAQAAHPLVLFLDDLQWIDAASLQLIEYVLTHPDTRYLMLIGAYRDNEVAASHPLLTSIDTIGDSVPVQKIRLAPLPMEALNRLLADTLHANSMVCKPLSQLIFEKTEGNPFFFTQFLTSLHKEELLRYDTLARTWQWDLSQIRGRNFTDNVVDLMLSKLRRLPLATQKTLQLAACLGNKFSLEHLSLVGEADVAEIEQRLSVTFSEGLVMLTGGSGKFLHDRIQQAAYSLIPESQRDVFHLRIGHLLLQHLGAEVMTTYLFDIANQFNRGAALLTDRKEREQVADINLRAGRKAKASAAYASAGVYFAAGSALLDESAWEEQYRLIFDLWLERTKCEFLNGHLNEAMARIAVLLQRAKSKVDHADIYCLKIQLHVVKSEIPQAIDSALTCLRLFAIDLPAHPTREQVQAEYDLVWRRLEGRSIESLIDLPPMTDPDMQAAMRVLSVLFAPAFFADHNLLHLQLCRMVNVSLTYGASDASTLGYGWFGIILGPAFHRYNDGYQFSKLAVDVVNRHGFFAYEAKAHFSMEMVLLWTQPINCAIDFIRTAFKAGEESGDLTITCYSCNHLVTDFLLRGDHLEKIWPSTVEGLNFVRKTGFADVTDILVAQQRLIRNMQGKTTSFSSFNDTHFNEDAFEARLTADRMSTMVCWYWIIKTQARFLSGDHEIALAASQQAKKLLWATMGHIQSLDYFYYTALAIAALHEKGSISEQRAWREQLAEHQEQLREWADNYPPTFGDKYALVAAEIARIDGRDLDAMHLYQQAITSAHDNGFVQNEGIAYECASAFYGSRGFDFFSESCIRKARDCFACWGASGKVVQLEALHPSLRTEQVSRPAISVGDGIAQLDVLAIAKASQAISGRIVLDELIDTLMRIMLENAGAQRGFLLLARESEVKLAADASVECQAVQVRLHQPGSGSYELPASILNYVRRSREQVLLADAAQPHLFSADEYFANHHPKSVVCLPILRQEALIGLLYLENSLITDAFTPERLSVLELLASQAAISLENALLYTDLREREARIRRLVESNVIGIMFWDLQGGIRDANDAFLRMLGYSHEEVLSGNLRWSDITPLEHRNADAHLVEEIRRVGSITPYEKEFIRKDGRRVPVLIGAARFEGSDEEGVAFVLDLTEQKQAEARIRHMAHYDVLTALPNRVLLQDRMKQAIAYSSRNRTQLAVLFVDLDYFKHINDSLGHSTGDRLLQLVATRLQQCVRMGDTVARLGGDEFVLSFPSLSIHDAALVAQKVLAALSPAFIVDGHELHVNASIGISLYPDDGADVESLMRMADMAMYHAKESGRGNYQFFTPALNKAAQRRLEVANHLSQALARDELVLYYQPQVNLETGKIFAAEALLRWRQHGASPISCGAFISVAEESGLILPIGEWVLYEACRQLKQWHDAGYPELRIAVNLSPRQFYQNDIIGTIESVLRKTGLPASALELEITESVLMKGSEDNMATLTRLGEMGIHLSVDDFGTGYSNLAYLHRFPITALKIDQSFVRGIGEKPSETTLVVTIIAMANGLRLKVLAEGVETLQQTTFLQSHGCLAAQGFYYSEAVPPEAFIRMVASQ